MASSDNEDEDLKTAIALSLMESQNPLPGDSKTNTKPNKSTTSVIPSADTAGLASKSGLGDLASLDRRAMEQERLARLARKRERSISPPRSINSRKAPRLEESTVSLPSGARLTFATMVDPEQDQRKAFPASAADQKLGTVPQTTIKVKSEPKDDDVTRSISSDRSDAFSDRICTYPNGIVKKTWAFGFDRNGEDVKLEEVLESRTLRTAVLSAFQWDTDWIMSKLKTPLNGGTTKAIFIMQAKEKELREKMLRDTEQYGSFLQLRFPPMEGQTHCMHSKLMLLFHSHKLRVVIPTANLLNFDWGETGMMENSVFMIDLPRRDDKVKTELSELTYFGCEMLYYLEKQGLDQTVRDGILGFDFSATKDIAFVHTVGGMSYGSEAARTGLLGLARAVNELNVQTEDSAEIDFAASSIGSLNNAFLKSLHSAARGEDLIKLSEGKTSKAKSEFFGPSNASSIRNDSVRATVPVQEKIRIYFPTQTTVRSSLAGAAGTICFSRRWFEAPNFPRSIFRDYRSTRPGLLSHNKIMYVRGKQNPADGALPKKNIAWAYVGSANLSKSAWGDVVFDRTRKAWKMNCRNWECGVLLPVAEIELGNSKQSHSEVKSETECTTGGRVAIKKEKVDGEDSETESENGSSPAPSAPQSNEPVKMEVFRSVYDPPFEVPGASYNGQQPWYFQEHGG